VRLVGCWLLRVEVELAVTVCGVFRLIVRKLLRVCLGDVRRDRMYVRRAWNVEGLSLVGLLYGIRMLLLIAALPSSSGLQSV
jgi:hypothetical protein